MPLRFKLINESTVFALTELFTYEQVPWSIRVIQLGSEKATDDRSMAPAADQVVFPKVA
jgi:hypothetical protein